MATMPEPVLLPRVNLWPLLIKLLFPLPALFFVLLCLPLPERLRRPLHRYTLRLYDRILNWQLFSLVPLWGLLTAVAAVVFVAMAMETYTLRLKESRPIDFAEKEHFRRRRWRSERNFWISLLGCVLWLLMHQFRRIIQEVEQLRQENKQLKSS